MKKYFIITAISLSLIACNNQATHQHQEGVHEGHDHAAHQQEEEKEDDHLHENAHDEHDHDEHEGHDHEVTEHSEECDHDHATDGHESEFVNEESIVGEITFTKEQALHTFFQIEKIKKSPFSSIITSSGEMLAMPGEKQNIAAQSHGVVLFATKNLVQGSPVKKGQLLFSISGKNITENNVDVKISETKNNYLKSKGEFERHKTLFAQNIISEKQFANTKYQYIKDSTEYYILATNGTKNGINVYAPLTGYLHELNISEGQHIETGQLLATISTNKVMLLRADVPQNYYQQIGKIVSARFRPAYTNHIYSVTDLKGRLLAKGSSVAENNHYIPIYFEVINDGSLLEGAFAEFYLILNESQQSITLPISSIMEEQGKFFAYVQVSDETYTKRYVETGNNNGERIVITNGLTEGEHVVTKGSMAVKVASLGAALPEHNHAH